MQWACEDFVNSVRAQVNGQQIRLQFQHIPLAHAIDAVGFVQSLRELGEIVPSDWISSEQSLNEAEGSVHVSGVVDEVRYVFSLNVADASNERRLTSLYRYSTRI